MDENERNTIYNLISELQETVLAMAEDLQKTKTEIFFIKARLYDILLTIDNQNKEVKK